MSTENTSEKERIVAFLLTCLKNWRYFVVSLVLCLALAFVYYKISPRVWRIRAKVCLAEDETLGASALSASSRLMSAFGVGGSEMTAEDEANKMSSHGFVRQAIVNLDINKIYFRTWCFGLVKKNLFDQSPLVITTDPSVPDTLQNVIKFTLDVGKSKTKIKMIYKKKTIGKYEIDGFPASIQTPLGQYTFSETEFAADEKFDKPYSMRIFFTPHDHAAQLFMEALDIAFEKKNSGIINLGIDHERKPLAKSILSEIISVYNAKYAENKAVASDKTIHFIDERLGRVKYDLDFADRQIAAFKDKNKLTDIEADVTYYYEMSGVLEARLVEAETQVKLVDLIDDFVRDADNKYALVPFSTVTLDPSLAELITRYNDLLSRLEDMEKNYGSAIDAYQDLKRQIDLQRNNLLQSLDNIKKGTQLTLAELKRKEKEISSKIGAIPEVEKDFINLKREQEIQQTIFLFLVEKREESMIKAVSLMPKLRIIDQPYSEIKAVSPDAKKIALLVIFFGGFALPVMAFKAAPYVKTYLRKRKK
jgi:uncharacterized protein involved in exopolysaccharide biosynthesis